MKKYILIISTLFLLNGLNSCSDRDLELQQPEADFITDINTEARMQQMLNGAYFSVASSNAMGSQLMVFGDILGDKIYNTASRAIFLQTNNFNYSGLQNQFNFYGSMYQVILSCNMVINNTSVPENQEVIRIKNEAKILRGFAYFVLVNYYSPSPTSAINQEYGVPIVLGNYDLTIQPARATVEEVYTQIISDLTAGMQQTVPSPTKKIILGSNAAKLLLSRVYLTRRAPGDAQLALQYATEVRDFAVSTYTVPSSTVPNPRNPFIITSQNLTVANYVNYFKGVDDDLYENHPETIWELDMNFLSNQVTGIGTNGSLPVYYNTGDPTRRGLLATKNLFDSFGTHLDVRRGGTVSNPNTGLFTNVTTTDQIAELQGTAYWMNKYPSRSSRGDAFGNFFRDIKVLRYSEAYLNRIEALRLLGQEGLALSELNAFALSRKGTTYTSGDLLQNILTEKSKEFYGEGQRFLDLKRYNLPVVRTTNCTVCELPASDHRFVLPISQDGLNSNPNMKQYPGYVN